MKRFFFLPLFFSYYSFAYTTEEVSVFGDYEQPKQYFTVSSKQQKKQKQTDTEIKNYTYKTSSKNNNKQTKDLSYSTRNTNIVNNYAEVKKIGHSDTNINIYKIKKLNRKQKYTLSNQKVIQPFGKYLDKNYNTHFFNTSVDLKNSGVFRMFDNLTIIKQTEDYIFAKNKKFFFKIEGLDAKDSSYLKKNTLYKTDKFVKLTVLKYKNNETLFVNPSDIFNIE